jgi:hypothetical protein
MNRYVIVVVEIVSASTAVKYLGKNADENRVPGIAEDAAPVIHDGGERGHQVEAGVQHAAHVT